MRTKLDVAVFAVLAALLAGCSGGDNSGPPSPRVRAINGLQGVALASVTVGAEQVSANLPYATLSGTPNTPYTKVPSGAGSISFASAATPGTPIVSSPRTFSSGDMVDAIAYGTTTPAVLQLLDDDSIPSKAAVRFVNASPASGSVDFVMGTAFTGSGTAVGGVAPVQTNGTATYQNLAGSGNFQISVYPAGQDSGPALISEPVNFNDGTRWTFVLLDSATPGGSPVLLQVQDNVLTDTATSAPKRSR
ncbi:MAG TPA: DUF4397 domain-containing protein [Fimbriimonas sp.]|nr:DUF4397 domain-containing protein [Fimbriimonas sp.]